MNSSQYVTYRIGHLTSTSMVFPLCFTWNNFCTSIYRFVHWWHMPLQTLLHCHRLPNHRVTNLILLFLQCGLWPLCVVNDLHIFPTNKLRPKIGTPIMRSLYCNPWIVSIPIFILTNYTPNIDVSIVRCFLENQALFRKIMYLVLDRLVILSSAWSESTNIFRSISLPLGLGALVGIASFTSP